VILVIVGELAIVCLLLIQGVYIVATGIVGFPLAPAQGAARLARLPRLGIAAVYLASGIAIFSLLVMTAIKRRITPPAIASWLMDHAAILLWLLLIGGGGVCGIFRPEILVSWAKTAHPQLSTTSPAALWSARVVGVGLLVMSIVILARL
jgi:hypothetical protein